MPLLSPDFPGIVIPAQAGISLLHTNEAQVSNGTLVGT